LYIVLKEVKNESSDETHTDWRIWSYSAN